MILFKTNFEKLLEVVRGLLGSFMLAVFAYFDSTLTFLYAILIAFALNIFAGFRADEVKIKLTRIIPPKLRSPNFNPNKFVTALKEFALTVFVIYILKSLVDLLKWEGGGVFVVQGLIAVACYFYIKNALRNLRKTFPNNQFIKFLDILIGLKFREIMGDKISDAIDKVEEEEKKRKKQNGN